MVEQDDRSVGGAWEFELQFATGDVVKGPYDRLTLREMLYTGRLTGDERIRLPGGSQFERLADRPEFQEVIAVLGPRQTTSRRSGGWRRSTQPVTKVLAPGQPAPAAPVVAEPDDATPSDTMAAAPGTADVPAPAPSASGRSPVLIAAGVVALLVLAGLGGFLSQS